MDNYTYLIVYILLLLLVSDLSTFLPAPPLTSSSVCRALGLHIPIPTARTFHTWSMWTVTYPATTAPALLTPLPSSKGRKGRTNRAVWELLIGANIQPASFPKEKSQHHTDPRDSAPSGCVHILQGLRSPCTWSNSVWTTCNYPVMSPTEGLHLLVLLMTDIFPASVSSKLSAIHSHSLG